MIGRLIVAEVAKATRRHAVTVRRALEAGELHGTQNVPGGRWTVREDCAEAWAEKQLCEHQRAARDAKNVTPIRARAAAS